VTVRAFPDGIALEGNCPAEDAEALLGLLIENAGSMVDLAECGSVHTAVAQVLLAARPAIRGVPADPLLADWILPQLLDAAAETNFRLGSGRLPEQD
jgi:hypothetical protein